MKFHELFKQKRMAIGTVREFARKSGLDLAYVSRLENGIILPPKDIEKLTRLASALKIAEGSDEWQKFMDLAAVARNVLPDDLRDNEKVVKVLPAFYRAMRENDIGEDELRRLLDLIKEAGEEE